MMRIKVENNTKKKDGKCCYISHQTVDKVSHYCAGFFFAKYQKVQCLCGLLGDFLV